MTGFCDLILRETVPAQECIKDIWNCRENTLGQSGDVHSCLCGVENTFLMVKLTTFTQKFSDFGGRRVEIGAGGTPKFSIYKKRVHFWASLVHPRLPWKFEQKIFTEKKVRSEKVRWGELRSSPTFPGSDPRALRKIVLETREARKDKSSPPRRAKRVKCLKHWLEAPQARTF